MRVLRVLFMLCVMLSPAAAAEAGIAPTAAEPATTVGVVLTLPEVFGIAGSLWPTPDWTIDARVTLASVDAGATWHMHLLNDANGARHDLLVTAMGGYFHNVATHYWSPIKTGRVIGAVGWGVAGDWDLRVQGGVSAEPTALGPWGTFFTGWIMLGKRL